MRLLDSLADHPDQKKCGQHDCNVEMNEEKVTLFQQHACDPLFDYFKRKRKQPHKVKNVIVEPVKIKDGPQRKIGSNCSNLV